MGSRRSRGSVDTEWSSRNHWNPRSAPSQTQNDDRLISGKSGEPVFGVSSIMTGSLSDEYCACSVCHDLRQRRLAAEMERAKDASSTTGRNTKTCIGARDPSSSKTSRKRVAKLRALNVLFNEISKDDEEISWIAERDDIFEDSDTSLEAEASSAAPAWSEFTTASKSVARSNSSCLSSSDTAAEELNEVASSASFAEPAVLSVPEFSVHAPKTEKPVETRANGIDDAPAHVQNPTKDKVSLSRRLLGPFKNCSASCPNAKELVGLSEVLQELRRSGSSRDALQLRSCLAKFCDVMGRLMRVNSNAGHGANLSVEGQNRAYDIVINSIIAALQSYLPASLVDRYSMPRLSFIEEDVKRIFQDEAFAQLLCDLQNLVWVAIDLD